VIEMFEAALRQPGWIDDKVPDQFPRGDNKTGSGMVLLEPDSGETHDDRKQGKKRGLSKTVGPGVDPEQLGPKRPKWG